MDVSLAHRCFSPSLSPSFPLSLKKYINKILAPSSQKTPLWTFLASTGCPLLLSSHPVDNNTSDFFLSVALDLYLKGTTHWVVSCVWFPLLSMVHVRVSMPVTCISSVLLFSVKLCSIVWIENTGCSSIYLSVGTWAVFSLGLL